MMKSIARVFALLTLSFVALAILPPAQAAVVKVGAVCESVKAEATASNGDNLICTKVRSKLLWKKVVTIGLSVSKSGALQKTGEEVANGYQLWADTVNSKGGLLGRQIKLMIYDDKSDPSEGVRLYTKLVTEDRVTMVLGPFSSAVTAPVAAYLDRMGYPLVTGGASAASIWKNGYTNVFGIYPSGKAGNEALFQVAKKLGMKTLAIVNEGSPFGRDIGTSGAVLAEKIGFKIVLREEFPPNTTDFSGLAIKLKQLNPDFLLAGTYYDQSTILAQAIASVGVKFSMFAETIGPESKDFIQAVGAASEGLFGITFWSSTVKAKGNEEFFAAYKQKYGKEPIYQAAMAYSAGEVLQAAIIRARTFDRVLVRDVLADFTVSTITGVYKVDQTGFQVGKQSFITQVQNGKALIVFPKAYAEATAKLGK